MFIHPLEMETPFSTEASLRLCHRRCRRLPGDLPGGCVLGTRPRLDGADKGPSAPRDRLPTAPDSRGSVKVVRRQRTQGDAALLHFSQQPVAPWNANPCFCCQALGEGNLPGSPQHPQPGGIHLLAPSPLPALPRSPPARSPQPQCRGLAERGRPLIFQTFSKFLGKIFYFFTCPGVLSHLPLPKSLFSATGQGATGTN